MHFTWFSVRKKTTSKWHRDIVSSAAICGDSEFFAMRLSSKNGYLREKPKTKNYHTLLQLATIHLKRFSYAIYQCTFFPFSPTLTTILFPLPSIPLSRSTWL